MPKQAGNSITTAFDIGTVDTSIKVFEDTISNADSIGYYKFAIAENSKLNIKLSGLSQDVNLFLLNSDGSQIVAQSAVGGNVDENIIQNLRAGSYYFYVGGGGTGTNYKLETSAISLGPIPVDNAGNTIDKAKNLGTLGSTVTVANDFVGNFNGLATDDTDYYQFTLAENSTVNLKLSGLSQDATLYLHQAESLGGGVIQVSANPDNADENITRNLRPGTWFVSVLHGGEGTNYKFEASAISLGAIPVDNAGNSFEQAKNLGVLGTTPVISTDFVGKFHDLATDNTDYYQFTLAENSTLNLKLSGLSEDVTLWLYDNQGSPIQNSATPGSPDENITRNLRAGIYYAYISNGGNITSYQFEASAVSLGAVPVDHAGDSFERAKNLGILGSTAIIANDYLGDFNGLTRDDSDYYQFTLAENGTVNLKLSGLSQDVTLNLYDSRGQQLFNSQGQAVQVYAQPGNADDNIALNLRAGIYYVSASSGGNGTSYQLSASSISLGAVPVDNAGDSFERAKNLGILGTTEIVANDFLGDFNGLTVDNSDYYQFTLAENSTVNLKLSGLSQNVNIQLFDAQGLGVQYSATAGNADELISKNLRAGTYCIHASGGGNGTNYQLTASAISLGDTPVDDNPINQANNLGTLGEVIKTVDDQIANSSFNYYKFTLAENSTVNLKLSGLSQDVSIYLLSSNGNRIEYSNQPENADESISKNLKADTYYLQVSGGTGTTYKLDASAISLGAFPVDNAGQTIDNAKDLGVLKSEVTSSTDFIGSFNGLASDFDDYYKFTLAENSTVNLNLSGLSQDANLDLYLRSSNGNRIQQSTLPNNVDENISQNLKAGSYYLQVRDGGSVKGTYYKLDASAISLGAFPVDNAGQNIDTAKDLGILKPEIISSTDFLGEFNGLASDYEDYYKFTLTENSTVNFNLSGLSQDANLSLLSRNGNLINNSIKAGNADENISQNLKADTYYLRISDASGSIIGTNYKLDASSTPLGGIPIDTAGDSFDSARDLGEITNPQQISEYIGNFNNLSNDFDDYYKFRVTSSSFVKFDFTGTSRNINASFLNASRSGFPLAVTTSNTLSQGLSEGTYFLRVSPTEGIGTKYQLNVSAPAIADFAGHDTQTARDIGVLNTARSFTDFVGQIDYGDFYRFELKEASTFNLNFNPERSINTTILHFANSQGQWLNTIDRETNQFTQELDAGVYYAQVYNFGGTNSDTYYNLSLSAIPKQDSGFQILGVNPIGGSNKGEATINIKGNKFTRNAQVSIIDPAGKVVSSSAVTVLNDSNITAKFDLKGQVTGAYDVQVVDQASQALVNDVFLVNDLQLGRLQVDIAATAIRPGGTGQAIVTYRNAGNTDIPAPFLTLVAPNGLLEESGEYKNNKIQFLAINKEGNAGVLPAGASGSFRVNFRDMGGVSLEVNSLALDENVDWNGIKDSSRPEGIAADVWDKIYSNFVTSVGGKASEFQKVLNENATRLSQLGEYTGDISRLLSFELQQVNSNAISARSTVGTFGRGGVNPWDVTAITDAAGDVAIQTGDRRRTFTKGKDGKYQGITDDLGILTKVGDVYQIKEFDGTVQSFLANGKLDFIQDTNGNKVTLGYTANLLTGLSYSNGDKVTFKYNAQGRVNEVVDIYGQSTTYTYDATGERLLSVSDVSGAVSYTYETEGAKANAIKSITYPDGTQSLFEYDDLGRVTQESLNGGEQTLKYSYDSTGGVTVTDANNKSTQVLLNDRGQVAETKDALGRVSRFSYDSKGNLTQVLAPDSSNAKFTYDSKGNLLASTDALGQSVQFAYDSRYDQIKSVRDQKGNAINYSYDDKGNLGSIGYADGSKESFTYSDKGDVTVSSNRRGQQISYTYDSRGLLTKKAFADGTSAAFEYDVRGNLTKATDADSSVTYGYDVADRLTNVSYGGTRSLSFSYDAGGRRSQMVDQDGFATNYSYDSVGRLKQITDQDGNNILSYNYNALGQITREDNGENGIYTVYSYNDVGAVLRIVEYLANDNTVNSKFDYTYDDLGRLISASSEEGKTSYGYDATGRLTSETSPTGLTEYQYDAAGNRTVIKDSGVDTSYITNNLNQYTKVGGTTYTYDRDGNLATKTQDGITSSYTYDSENHLVEVKTPDATWKYEYDALGNKIATVQNNSRTEYLPDSLNLRYVSGGGSGGSSTGSATSQFSADSTISTYSGQWDVLSIVAATYDDVNIFTNAPTTNRPTGQTNSPIPQPPVPQPPVPQPPAPIAPAPTTPAPTASIPKPSGDNPDCDSSDKSSFYNAAKSLRLHLKELTTTKTYLDSNDIDGAIRHINEAKGAKEVLAITRGINIKRDVANYIGDHLGFRVFYDFEGIQNEISGLIGDLLKQGFLNAAIKVGTIILGIPSAEETVFKNRLDKIIGKLENFFNISKRFQALIEPITDTIRGLELIASSPESCNNSKPSGSSSSTSDGSSSVSFPPPPNPKATPPKDGLSPKPKPKPPKPILPPNPKSKPPTGDIPPNPVPKPPNPNPPFNPKPEAQTQVPVFASRDPNDIIGPGGTGPDRWLTPDPILPYTIRFENIATATAPAVLVNITHTLDSDLDLNTFELGDFGFGSTTITVPDGLQNYTTRLDLRNTIGDFVDFTATLNTTTRLVTWKIITIDALTGQPADGVTDGFLPPNNTNRDGEGFVNYRVKSKSDTPNGASLDAQASIVFDTNEAIETPVWSNKIDTNAPSSQVTALSANSSTNFNVAWTGADNGSGVAKYDIYVSDNGGDFTIWKQGITDTSATYTGELNHVYRFYSVATDGVGFRESAPNQADTSTTVVLVNNPPTVANLIADQNAKQGIAFNFQIPTNTFTDIDSGDVLTYSATLENGNNLPSWLSFNPDNRSFSGTPANADVGILNIKVTATDILGETVSNDFSLTVDNVNDAPTLENAIADQSTAADKAFSFTFDANTFIDVDADDSLTYSATLKDGSNLPNWLKFNPATRTFNGTPTNANVGSFTIQVRATDNDGLIATDTFLLAVEQGSISPTLKLSKIADDIFNVFDSSGKSKLQVTLTERSSNLVNELGIFTVDDAQGKINGIAPGSSSYAQAALDRAKVIFSAIANLPNGFNTNNLTHLLEFNSGENLRFYLVRNSTIDAVRAGVTPLTDILFSDPLKQKITDLGSDEFSIAWKDKDGNSTTDFKDLVVKIQSTNDSLPLGTNLQGKPQGEVIDLRGVTSQVKADFIVNREAAFNNFIGFYQVADENGGIDTNSDGKADIFAGQAGYIEAAIRGRVAGIDLTVNNQGTATYTGTFQPGTIFAPFIIVDGRPEALLDSNPNNNPAVYFPFLGANADKVDHIRLLGNNVFGFEDLPNGGDKDFNDVIVRVNVSIV
ncbi:MAG: pre-peptidase C-terminal domain-containing protein [Aphanizomenon gracile PMC627.10]|nr:pre-peptidase C-terminal domain-containing protein [Aphanizomenon gracile PMC627.10]